MACCDLISLAAWHRAGYSLSRKAVPRIRAVPGSWNWTLLTGSGRALGKHLRQVLFQLSLENTALPCPVHTWCSLAVWHFFINRASNRYSNRVYYRLSFSVCIFNCLVGVLPHLRVIKECFLSCFQKLTKTIGWPTLKTLIHLELVFVLIV